MRFEFEATVDQLDYDTEAEVEKQALSRLGVPDMTILILQIGTWRPTHDDPAKWAATVQATVDDGRGLGERPGTHAVIWPNRGEIA